MYITSHIEKMAEKADRLVQLNATKYVLEELKSAFVPILAANL